jgi:hypothetical protein
LNLRFRQSDWLHRIFVFFQLGIFSALAAFTRIFDITASLLQDEDQPEGLRADMLQLGNDENNLAATQFRDDRVLRLNVRGVAMTMALSPLLLLVQYAVGENFQPSSYAKYKHSLFTICFHGRRFAHKVLITHRLPLAFSALSFLATFAIIGSDMNTPRPQIHPMMKIIL